MDLGFLLSIIILFLVDSSAVAVDYRFEACAPRVCGNINIRYPFYMLGQQESYCGYDDWLGVNCSNPATPIIHTLENDYVMDKISYESNTCRVHFEALSNTADCLPQLRNISEYGYINISESPGLHLLWNCTAQLPGKLVQYRRDSCGVKDGGGWGLAMLGDDQNLGAAMAECKINVLVPVDISPGEDNGLADYVGLLMKGFEFTWTGNACTECVESGGRCGFNYTTGVFQCFCADRPHRVSCRHRKPGAEHLAPLILGPAAGIIFFTCFFVGLCKFKKSFGGSKDQNLEALIRHCGSVAPKRFSYSDIRKMTSSFKDELGKGGYGTVYKGKIPDGNLVAVKLLNSANGNGQDFINEVLSISSTSHVNVVKLMGFCIHGKKRALVYEYMANGSLEKYIHSQKNDSIFLLGMDKLYQISLGVARGLEYLHRGCNTRILHFDIKPHNILLDDQFCPKISDFGMSKQYSTKKESVVSSFLEPRGTIGYIAPELISRCFGAVSYKSDVYSFGMMILEIVGRRKNVIRGANNASEVFFPAWAFQHLIVIDKDLHLKGAIANWEEDEVAKKIILVGLWCIQKDPSQRPAMSRVIETLEGDLQAIQIPPKPFFDSSSSSSAPASFDHREEDISGLYYGLNR